jgi:integrase
MTKKRANGEGSVFRRADGRVVGVCEDATCRTRYITSKTMTKTEMKAAVRKKLQERDERIAHDSEGLTLGAYLDRWLEFNRDRVLSGTFNP